MSGAPEPPGDDSEVAAASKEVKSPFIRQRNPVVHGPYWDLPEGELATPAQSTEFRHRLRPRNTIQTLKVFVFIPLAAWLGYEFLDHLVVQLLYFVVAGALAIAFHFQSQRNFRCPVCAETFPVIRQSLYDVSRAGGRWSSAVSVGAITAGRASSSTRRARPTHQGR